MSSRKFDKGNQGISDDTINGSTGVFKMMAISPALTDAIIKAVSTTTASGVSPIVVTCTAHGWSNGHTVVIYNVGGNTAANGTWIIANVATNTFELTTVPAPGGTALNSTGNGTYTSGGSVINLSLSSASTDVDGARAAGSTDQTVTVNVTTPGNGVWDCNDPVFSLSASTVVTGFVMYQSSPTDRLLHWNDGKQQVRVDANAATSATTVVVEPLYSAIASGTALIFSNGVTATLSAQANAGDRSLTVTALSAGINAGHTADAPIGVSPTAANLPYTAGSPGTTSLTLNIDATNGVFKLN